MRLILVNVMIITFLSSTIFAAYNLFENLEQAAPTGIVAVSPTNYDSTNGKIIGTTTAMEYKLSTADNFTTAASTTISGLAAGSYQVRYQAKEGYNAGAIAYITIDPFPYYYSSNLSSAMIIKYYGNATDVVIPATLAGVPVKIIDAGAFQFCTSITSITLPNSITSIGIQAFDGCNSLVSVVLSTSLTTLEDRIFLNCTSLTDITIPINISTIIRRAFLGCTSLARVTMENNATTIGTGAFVSATATPNFITIYGAAKANTYSRSGDAWTIALTEIGAISGVAIVGGKLTAGTLTPAAATVSYKWQAGTENIGTNSASYTVQIADVGKPITVIASGTASYSGIVTSSATEKVIALEQTAPSLSKIDETVASRNDGKIIGVSSAMEYKLLSNATYAAISGSVLNNLAAGTYQVRFQAKAGYKAGEDAEITIASGLANTYTLSITAPSFAAITYGAQQASLQAILITNSGNTNANITNITVSGDSFILRGSGMEVAYGDSINTWTIQPQVNLTAGTHTEAITISYNNMATIVAEVSITVHNAEQIAPIGLESIKTTSYGLSDGKITGTTAEMEYKLATESLYKVAKAAEINGLAAGTYLVRYQAKINYNAGDAVELEIAAGKIATYNYTYTNTDILVNGLEFSGGVTVEDNIGGQSTTTIILDEEKITTRLRIAGEGAVVKIPFNTSSTRVVSQLNGQLIKNLEDKQAIVEMQTPEASYILPASQIKISAISAELGKNLDLKDIKVSIEISKATLEQAQVLENAARLGTFKIFVPAVGFSVSCSYGDKTILINEFSSHVERTIALSAGIDPAKITTSILVEQDGTVRHIPTKIVIQGWGNFAIINSLTNSIYALVGHPIEFKDVSQHWAKHAINDMGSRMVVKGIRKEEFAPNRAITRAEFTAILMRGLGIKTSQGTNSFADVQESAWYSGAIATATAYNLISGYGENEFAPQKKITREEAISLLAKAMQLSGLRVQIQTSEAAELLAKFQDSQQISAWARQDIAKAIQQGIIYGRSTSRLAPKATITRAEATVLIQRLLIKANLI